MDGAFDTSNYHPKLPMIFNAKTIHGHKVKKCQTENFGFGWWDIYFRSIFVKNAKIIPEYFSRTPEIGQNVKIAKIQKSKKKSKVSIF